MLSTCLPCCRIVKLVRAMRKGWLKRRDEQPPEKRPVYLLWQDDGMAADHTQAGEPLLSMHLCCSTSEPEVAS